MMKGLWGKKIGMTQIFAENQKVIPVTAIDVSNWYITQIKTKEIDGYSAVKLGYVKGKFSNLEFSSNWLKEPQKYFSAFKEVAIENSETQPTIGQKAQVDILTKGEQVDVFGITKGAGYQGVVKRHGYSGGRASHGATFGRFTGSLSFMRSRGRVIKGKGMPGHMGVERRMMKNLEVVKVEPASSIVLVKGSVPGKSGSLVFVRKNG